MVARGSRLTPGARFFRAGLASALVLGLAWVLVLNPQGHPLCTCLFREIAGVSCLTCGLTRSLQAVCRGDLQAAARFHVFGPLVLAGAFLATLAWLAEALLGKRLVGFETLRRRLHLILGTLTVWIAYGIIRVVAELV